MDAAELRRAEVMDTLVQRLELEVAHLRAALYRISKVERPFVGELQRMAKDAISGSDARINHSSVQEE